ncbi:MAG: tRNA pseudouridine(54/55) synthase Pus10 [Candidatus Lokiarchaeota archaeon]|nr:tRNA pseudouridine(54/55) synthase Pus10 [Candidatus Lokiarchaeota archaeon]
MSILNKVLNILDEHYLCLHCLGRMFALLGTHTTNDERGSSLLLTLTLENHATYLSKDKESAQIAIKNLNLLANNARFEPARKVLEQEGFSTFSNNNEENCFLCRNIFENTSEYIKAGIKVLESIEFENFLIGTSLDPEIINKEDQFKSKYNLIESESFKSHFNREIGRKMALKLNKPSEFNNPEVTLVYSLGYESFSIETMTKSVFIRGRYNKLIRGIPQTHWDCRACQGRGCEKCDNTGKQYMTSVEELISPEFLRQSLAQGTKFHGAGREDIDVRMLGDGRPFVLELIRPIKRRLNLNNIEKITNKKNKKKIRISQLDFASKKDVIKIKTNSEHSRKSYKAIGQINLKITKEEFDLKVKKLKELIVGNEINQRTPIRVSHRRSDKYRTKFIHDIQAKYLKPNLFEFYIEVQGGTYIKELIHGDNGRTTPSFSDIFGTPMICKELDVIEIFQ